MRHDNRGTLTTSTQRQSHRGVDPRRTSAAVGVTMWSGVLNAVVFDTPTGVRPSDGTEAPSPPAPAAGLTCRIRTPALIRDGMPIWIHQKANRREVVI